MRVLSFGEILFDIIMGEHCLGGAPLNFAAHLASCGVESYILSKVGKDPLGKSAMNQIKELGVQTSLIATDDFFSTGTVEVVLKDGQPDYTIHEPVAYDFINLKGGEEAFEDMEFDVFYFGTLAQRNPHSRKTLSNLLAQKKFPHIFYDVNLRKGFFTEEVLQFSLLNCSILKMNDEEVEVLGEILFRDKLSLEDFLRRIAKEYRIGTVIVTAGGKGCMVYDQKTIHSLAGYPADVVDTIGAGDSFSAAFLYQYFYHQNPVKAADVANRLGAYVASCRGPIPKYSPEIKKALQLN